MDIMPTSPSDFSGENVAMQMQVSLLKKTQDIAAQQVQALLPQPSRSASMSTQGNGIDISA